MTTSLSPSILGGYKAPDGAVGADCSRVIAAFSRGEGAPEELGVGVVLRVPDDVADRKGMLFGLGTDEDRGLQQRFVDRLLELGDQAVEVRQTVSHHPFVGGDDTSGDLGVAGAHHLGDIGQRDVEVAESLDHLGVHQLRHLVGAVAGDWVDAGRDQQALFVVEPERLDRHQGGGREHSDRHQRVGVGHEVSLMSPVGGESTDPRRRQDLASRWAALQRTARLLGWERGALPSYAGWS